jgi:hypothetical protein
MQQDVTPSAVRCRVAPQLNDREDGQARITRHEVGQVLGRVQDAEFWSLV